MAVGRAIVLLNLGQPSTFDVRARALKISKGQTLAIGIWARFFRKVAHATFDKPHPSLGFAPLPSNLPASEDSLLVGERGVFLG